MPAVEQHRVVPVEVMQVAEWDQAKAVAPEAAIVVEAAAADPLVDMAAVNMVEAAHQAADIPVVAA